MTKIVMERPISDGGATGQSDPNHEAVIDDQIKQDEMNGTYNTHGRDEKLLQNFSRKF
jgi:hypothetical protein